MAVGGLLKAGSKLLDDVLEEAVPARKGFAQVEEIDLGDTPLPQQGDDMLDGIIDEFAPRREADELIVDPMDEQAAINALDDELDGFFNEPEIEKMEIVEEIDLDREFIGIRNQNAPDDIFTTGAADGVEWVQDLNPEEIKALNVMSHVRGAQFPNVIREKVIKNNYDRDANINFPPREVVEEMRDIDLAAINFYTRAGDSIMNDTLRAGAVEQGSEVEAAINAMDTAMDNLPAWNPEDGLLYRSLGKDANETYGSLKPGDVISDKGYASTTRDKVYDPETKEFTFEGTPAPAYFVITPKEGGSGRAIEGLSDWGRQEAEVLYRRGTEFRLVRKEQKETEVMMFRAPNETRTTTIYFLEEV